MTVTTDPHGSAPRPDRRAAAAIVPAPRRTRVSQRDRAGLRLLQAFATLDPDDPRRDEIRSRVIQAWLPFARRLARRFHDRGESRNDLEQIAAIGLIKAIDRFNPGYGNDFVAFATPTVLGEIRRHFRDHTWDVHVPRRLQELKLGLNQATGVLSQRLGRTPTVGDLAGYLRRGEDEVLETLDSGRAYTAVSLQSHLSGVDGTTELGELIGVEDPDLALVDTRAALASAMHLLGPREQKIIALRFFGNLGQAQIAQRIGVSQMHVSRLLTKSLAVMREHLAAEP
jgi:RNA polymerase sigma-B factor